MVKTIWPVLFSALFLLGNADLFADAPEDKPQLNGTKYSDAEKLVKTKEYAKAKMLFEELNQQKPGNPDVLNYLGFTSRMTGDKKSSLKYYQMALKINPKHLGANEYLGELYLELDDLKSSQAQLAKIEKICGQGCVQYTKLTRAMDNYKKKGPTGIYED